MYLTIVVTTIAMVLVQEDDIGYEHLAYYLSQNLNDIEIKYTHIENLDLPVFQVVQIFLHYILL